MFVRVITGRFSDLEIGFKAKNYYLRICVFLLYARKCLSLRVSWSQTKVRKSGTPDIDPEMAIVHRREPLFFRHWTHID